MSNNENQFIANLTSELQPSRYWRPSWRASLWALLALILNIAILLLVQPFRPQFAQDILQHPRFLFELLSATSLTAILIYYVFHSLVPGKKLNNVVLGLGSLSLFVLIYTLIASFYEASPPSSQLGHRSLCVEEVFVYGLVGLGFFYYFIKKVDFGFSRGNVFIAGLAAGLIPGTLMQLACSYSPLHSVLLHYGPALLLALLASLTLPFFKK